MWPEILDQMRLRMGSILLRWAVALLPEHAWERKALERELREQRDYERYEGYTLAMGGEVLPFERWRSEWRGMTRLRRPLQMPQRQESNERPAFQEARDWSADLPRADAGRMVPRRSRFIGGARW